MPVDLSQSPQDFRKAVEQGQLPADRVGPMLDEYVSNQLLEEIKAGLLPRAYAVATFDRIRKGQMAQQKELERAAYHKGSFVYAPESLLGAGAATAGAVVPQKILPHLPLAKRLFNPTTWREAASSGLGAAALPFNALVEMGTLGAAPWGDPLYQRGERGYFGSLSEAAKSRMDQFEQAGKNTRERYGALGAPIQALQNTFNPLTGTAFTGRELYKALNGPTAEELAMEAEKDLSKYLGG
jgi:hypothetical protein